MRLTSDDLHLRGVALSNSGRLSAAYRTLQSASRRAVSRDQRARIVGTLAYVLTRTGRPDEAEAICRDALDEGDGRGRLSTSSIAVLHGQLGALAVERGDFDQALSWLERAVGAESNEARLGGMLTNRGVALMRLGRLAQSKDALHLAARYYRSAGFMEDHAVNVHNRGYVDTLEGDMEKARERRKEERRRADP